MKLQSGSNAITMAVSILAIGLAVASTSRASDAAATDADASTVSGTTSSARPDRAKVEAAMKTCRESAGIAEGTRPTQAQHETIHACMTAAGFDRPPGPPRDGAGAGPRDGRGHHGPPPDGLGAGARAATGTGAGKHGPPPGDDANPPPVPGDEDGASTSSSTDAQ